MGGELDPLLTNDRQIRRYLELIPGIKYGNDFN